MIVVDVVMALMIAAVEEVLPALTAGTLVDH
jgi:hypothetical protein